MGLKVVTIGGGSSYTPELVEGFIKRYDTFPISELWLVDIEEGKEKLEIVGNLAKRMVEKSGLPIEVNLTLNRREALKDADFVTTQLRVGLLAAREKDERIPLSHGILGQETNGAGGLFKALRTIPVILDIVEDIKELCPNAWVINFTNPAGMVTEAVYRYGNFDRFVGLCNVPIGMERSIAKLLDKPFDKVRMLFGGLNHMVFGLKIFVDGVDETQKTLEFMTNEETVKKMGVKNINNKIFEAEFIRALGVLPCPYFNYYFKKIDMLNDELEQYEKGNVRAQAVQKIEASLFELYKDAELKEKPKQLEERGGAYYSDAACRLIDSIYNDRGDIQPVNTRNRGSITNLDYDCVVEVSSVITKNGPIPLTIGKLPVAINGLVQQLKSFESVAIDAAVEGCYQKALLALAINPLTPSDTMAKVVLDEMLEAHKKYLPRFFR